MTRSNPMLEVSQHRLWPTLLNLALEGFGEFAHVVQRDHRDDELARVGWRGAEQPGHAGQPAGIDVQQHARDRRDVKVVIRCGMPRGFSQQFASGFAPE